MKSCLLDAEPQSHARAAALGGAAFGAADNALLNRVASRFSDHLQANPPQAVGGPTGAEPAK